MAEKGTIEGYVRKLAEAEGESRLLLKQLEAKAKEVGLNLRFWPDRNDDSRFFDVDGGGPYEHYHGEDYPCGAGDYLDALRGYLIREIAEARHVVEELDGVALDGQLHLTICCREVVVARFDTERIERRNKMEYPESDASYRYRNLSVVQTKLGHYCGYCRLPRMFAESGYGGLLRYVPVHGGITYAEQSENGQMVYGFDCAHYGDETNPRWWDYMNILKEARKMEFAIWIATFFELFYLLPLGTKWKAHVIDAYLQACRWFGIYFDLRDNFGAMIAVLCGDL